MFVRLKPHQLQGDPLSLEKEEETDDELDSDDFGADRDTEFDRKMDGVIQNRIESQIDENGELISKDVEDSSWVSGADIGAEMILNIAAGQPMTKIPTATSVVKRN